MAILRGSQIDLIFFNRWSIFMSNLLKITHVVTPVIFEQTITSDFEEVVVACGEIILHQFAQRCGYLFRLTHDNLQVLEEILIENELYHINNHYCCYPYWKRKKMSLHLSPTFAEGKTVIT